MRGPKAFTWVLQASCGLPLIIMPHEPHTPIRQEHRKASEPSWCSLTANSASSTVMPGDAGIVQESVRRPPSPSGRYRATLTVSVAAPCALTGTPMTNPHHWTAARRPASATTATP
jgi:hypothetical protein